MLFKAGTALIVIWLLGLLGPYRAGQLGHMFLLVGLLLLLLAMVKARDAAMRRPGPTEGPERHDAPRH